MSSKEKKTLVGFYVTQAEADHLKAKAKEQGRPLSNYLRARIFLPESVTHLKARKGATQ